MEIGIRVRDIYEFVKKEVVDAFEESKWLPFFTALAVLSSNIGPIPHISYVHVPLILLCIVKNIGRHWTVEAACVCFIFYLPLNVIITNPDPVFQSWPRMCFFMIVFSLAAPLFKGVYIAYIRRGVLHGILLIAVIMAIGSFFCYFAGVNYMKNQFNGDEISAEQYMGSAGAFGGLTNQSIVLGLFSGLSAIYMFYRANKYPENKKKYWICIGVLMLTLLFAASRSGLLSTLSGLFIMLYQKYENKANFVKIVLAIVIGAMLTFPLWEGATEGMMKKQNRKHDSEAKYGSRSEKWEARMAEFSNSPVFGVGFSAQDPNGKDSYDKKRGIVEPGSSWLCILSMTGIIGFIFVVLIIVKPFFYLINNPSPYNTLLLGLLVFFMVAFIAEGYIYAGGSALCFIAWLVIGCANDARAEYFDEEEIEDVNSF